MSSEGRFVEVQGTGEQGTFSMDELQALLAAARGGIATLEAAQRGVLGGAAGMPAPGVVGG
jgi:ribonuclease PH